MKSSSETLDLKQSEANYLFCISKHKTAVILPQYIDCVLFFVFFVLVKTELQS